MRKRVGGGKDPASKSANMVTNTGTIFNMIKATMPVATTTITAGYAIAAFIFPRSLASFSANSARRFKTLSMEPLLSPARTMAM